MKNANAAFQIKKKSEKRREKVSPAAMDFILNKRFTAMTSPLQTKSLDFASQVILFYESFSNTRRDTTVAKQLLRSATSIGANINEAVYGNSKADFIAKLHIALKETGESIYWLTLLKRTELIEYDYDSLLSLADEIKRMLIASINTAKGNKM